MLTKASEQILAAHAGLPAERVDRIAAECIDEIVGRNLLVGTGTDPGLRGAAMSAVLESLDEIVECPAQYRPCRGAAEETAQSARDQLAQAGAGLSAGCASGLPAQ
jgi:hypothetical protein